MQNKIQKAMEDTAYNNEADFLVAMLEMYGTKTKVAEKLKITRQAVDLAFRRNGLTTGRKEIVKPLEKLLDK